MNSLCLLVDGLAASRIAVAWMQCVDFVEDMLRSQIVAAIGKVCVLTFLRNYLTALVPQIVKPAEFARYMRYHNEKLFR